MSNTIITELDLGFDQKKKTYDAPFILGQQNNEDFNDILTFMQNCRAGLAFIGDPGTGKTHTATEAVKEYARRNGCQAYTSVVDEDTTKASILLGHRIDDGSLTTFPAVAGHCLQNGHACFVDELTHGELSVQSIFNTVIDQNARTTIGDLLLNGHPRARFVFGFNRTQHPGNVGIKTSFGSRLYAWPFDYPDARTETLIAKSIAWQYVGKTQVSQVPDSVIKYLVSWARNVRDFTDNYIPVSARNVALMTVGLSLLSRDTSAKMLAKFGANGGTSSKAIRERTAEWVFFQKPQSDADLLHDQVNNVFAFISQMGEERFKRAVLKGSMYYLDIEGILPTKMKSWREMMADSLC